MLNSGSTTGSMRSGKTRSMAKTTSRRDLSDLTPVVVYVRYSTLLQDSRSNEDQVRRCRVYAAAHGMEIVDIYSDAAESGSHIEREGMQRLLHDARARGAMPFRVVLVDDLSRLSR